jgi:uncharacterized protein (TIGR01244 family)
VRMLPAILALLILHSGGVVLPQDPHSRLTKESLPGSRNVTRVEATVACGGATSPEAMPELKRRGFAAVINLRLASEPGAEIEASRHAASTAGLAYIHIPFDGSNPDREPVRRFLAEVARPENQPVFIHCGTANRVGAMWLIKRVLLDGWEERAAVAEAEAIGLSSARLKQFALEYIAAHRGTVDTRIPSTDVSR